SQPRPSAPELDKPVIHDHSPVFCLTSRSTDGGTTGFATSFSMIEGRSGVGRAASSSAARRTSLTRFVHPLPKVGPRSLPFRVPEDPLARFKYARRLSQSLWITSAWNIARVAASVAGPILPSVVVPTMACRYLAARAGPLFTAKSNTA